MLLKPKDSSSSNIRLKKRGGKNSLISSLPVSSSSSPSSSLQSSSLKLTVKSNSLWDKLPWIPVNESNQNLNRIKKRKVINNKHDHNNMIYQANNDIDDTSYGGNFNNHDDSSSNNFIFFGLEKIDGNAFVLNKSNDDNNNNYYPQLKQEKKEEKKKEKKKVVKKKDINDDDHNNNEDQNDNNYQDDNNHNVDKDNHDNDKDNPGNDKNDKDCDLDPVIDGNIKNTLKKKKSNKKHNRVDNNNDDNKLTINTKTMMVHKNNNIIKINNYSNYIDVVDYSFLSINQKQWSTESNNSSISLSSILIDALHQLEFLLPTPIQIAAIPLTLMNHNISSSSTSTITNTISVADGSSNSSNVGGDSNDDRSSKINKGLTGHSNRNSNEYNDIIGIAETGSGKTLAYILPILQSLLLSYNEYSNIHTPYALILSPTRELALQISIVIKEISKKILLLSLSHYQQHQQVQQQQQQQQQQQESQRNSHHHHQQQQQQQVKVSIEVVTIVGGMSEHKQKRQLSGMGE